MNRTFSSFVPTANQIVFIDSQVADYQILAAGVVSDTEVVILEANQDGIKQIAKALRQKPYSTVHIVSHGSPGCLYLGNSQLSIDTLAKYTKELKTWFNQSLLLSCSPASLLLYGCNVAAGDAGEEFIAKLRDLTDAEIAASTTSIGNAAKGGNWELDVTTEQVNSNIAFTQATQAAYSGVFATYDDNNTETANAGNTVTKTFNVTENVTINDVNLGLNLNHNYRGDLRVTLISPSNTSVEIISSSDDFLDNYDLLLSDLSTNPVNSTENEITASPIYQEDYLAAPSNPFSAFAGENSTGTWTLNIENISGTASNGRPLTFNSSRLGINAPPWNPNPNNGGILVRGASFISCGTITDNGLDSAVLAVERIDIDANGNPVIPASGEVEVTNPLRWSHQDWTQEKLGNVYGTDIDLQGNMYAAASANYGSGFGFTTGVSISQINYGSIGGSLANGQGGKTNSSSDPTIEANELAAAGTIYKMDAVTGEPTVFAVLPQQSTTVTNIAAESGDPDIVRNNSGVGLGNIHHDKINNQFFVSNFEDGRIYRLDNNGDILDSYDPGTLDDGNAGVVPIDEMVYGLTVSPDGSQLFFGRNRTVYSIDLNTDGSFPGTVNNSSNLASYSWDNYTEATETPHSTIPNDVNTPFPGVSIDVIISDLDFLPTGELVVGGRMYADDNIFSSYNHGGHNYILEDTSTPGLYADQTQIIGFSHNAEAGGDDGYGGVGYSKQLDNSFDYVFSSADIIDEPGPHGIVVFPDTFTNGTGTTTDIQPKGAISYGVSNDPKGVGGDVDVFNPGSIQGNVFQDTTGDGNGDTALSGVTLTLYDADGTTPINDVDGNPITATTDENGNYVFDNLFPGDYTVVQDQPAGLVSIDETEGGTDGDNPSGDNIVNNRISVTVDPEENDLGNDFIEAVPGTITGNVLEDTNGDGSGNDAISPVTLTLLDSDGNVVETKDTDVNGDYSFTNVVPGNYTVVQTQPGGFVSVTPNTLSVTVTPGETDSDNNFVEEALPDNIDFGDAPDTQPGSSPAPDNATLADYQTTVDDGGASHVIDEDCPITIGSDVDADNGIQQNATATADDTDGTPDDEDGVFIAGTNNTLNNAEVNIDASNYNVDVVVNAQAPVTINDSAATITGVAYQDYDLDGTQDPSDTAANGGQAGGEPGMGGVIVNAYDADNTLVDTTITSSDRATLGQYTLNISANEQSQLRLEFVTPDGVFAGGSGTAEGDLIRFVDTSGGSVSDVDVALNRPEDYYSATSQGNPWVVIPCYVPGAFDGTNPESFDGINNSGEYGLVAFRYNNSGIIGSAGYVAPVPIADHGQVGATYGVAYDNVNTNIFTSAFQRSNTSFGPGVAGANTGFGADGAGTIYVVPFDDNAETFGAPTPYVDLNQVFGAGTVLGDNPDDTDSDPNNNYERDGIGLNQAGKTSFGDLEYYEDNLYTVNLTDKSLYAIPTSGTLDSNTIDSFAIPTPTPVSNSGTGTDSRTAAQIASDMRPFGLGVNDGKIYVGLVDSVESTGNRDYLRAYVYTFDPDTGGFSSNPIFDFDLTYTKGDPTFSDMEGNEEDWQTWTNEQPGLELSNPTGNGGFAYPQPMLADIEFDNGSLVLGLRDRNADQMGNFTFSPINGDTSGDDGNERRYETNSGGDILRAAPDGSGGYILESNSSVPDGFGGTLVSAVPPNNQGPGGGEFYPFERLGQRTNSHNETALGGLTQLPGESEVLSVVFDPLDTIRSGGVARYSNLDGSINGEYQIYNETDSNANTAFSKTSGLGDIEALLNSAPIEVGNRIFLDKDTDGIQDANEAGIAGVTVRLFGNGTEIATATTDAEGKYSFGGINAPDLLDPNTSYQIRIDDGATTPLENYGLTLQNANSDNSDSIDSDAEVDAGNTVINFTTGDAGENNFTLDAGYTDGVTLVGWIDFNRDGVFSDTEAVALDTSNGLVADGSTPNSLTFPVPGDAEPGPTAARFRVASGLTGDNLDGTTPNGSLPNGEVEDYVVNLVQLEPGSISGNVFEDNTGDGNSNGGIFNVELTLLDNVGNVVDTAFTDNNGNYSFPDVPPGDYTIVQTQPAGYNSVSENEGGDDNDPGDTTLNNRISVTVESNVEDTGNNFLESQLGTITGNVLEDTDGDGNGEAAIPSQVTLTLLDSDGNVVETTNTDNNGDYSFTNVVPGNYTVVQSQPAGYVSVAENEGGADDDNPDNDNTVNNRISVTVTPNETDTDNDFVEALPGAITGNVLQDIDGDGNGEAAISPQVTLTLLDSDGNTVDTTTTDGDGNYSFTNVIPGNYTVVQTQPPGYVSVAENEGGADNDNPGNDNTVNNRISVTVTPNETDTDNDFLEELTPSDFGDAPDTYQTTIFNNGARHIVNPNITIGTNIDADDGTQQNASATADDNDLAGDDEEGVTFTEGTNISRNDPDNSYSVDVVVNAPTITTELASEDFDDDNNDGNLYNDGTGWAGEWIDYKNRDAASNNIDTDRNNDRVQITGGVLQLRERGFAAERLVDLSSTTGTINLNFDFQTIGNVDPSDSLKIFVSNDGTTAGLTEVASIVPASNSNQSIDISNFINNSGNTLIRFRNDIDSGLGGGDGYNIDNVQITETTSTDATLVSWIDFNRDGVFDPGEGVVNSIANGNLNNGTPTTVTWTNFTDDINLDGDTYARFRLSSDNLTVNDAGGAATDGEVEDYQLAIADYIDYGDAPDPTDGTSPEDYQTTEANGGPSHGIVPNLSIGSRVDADNGTQQNPAATADDNDLAGDDEDGVSFTEGTSIEKNDADNSYSVEVVVNTPTNTTELASEDFDDDNNDGNLYNDGTGWASEWIDYENRDAAPNNIDTDRNNDKVQITGGVLQLRERGFAAERLVDLSSTTGTVTLNFDFDTVGNVDPGDSLKIFVSNDGTTANLTEVASIVPGNDANQSIDISNFINNSGNTLIRFRNDIDSGLGGNDGYNIDNVQITETTSTDATLVSWIDFNRDGVFDPEEGVVNSIANGDLNNGTPTTVTWTDFTDDITSNGDTYARFRLSSDNLTVNDATGAATDGEVEDHQLSTVGVEFDYGDAPDDLPGSVSASENLANNNNDFPDYQTTEDDGGANHIIVNGLTIGTAIDGDDGTQENPAADADGADEDGVDFTSEGTTIDKNDADNSYSVEVTVNVPGTITDNVTLVSWIDFNRDGEFDPEEGVVNSTANGNLNTDGTPTTVTWTNFTDDIASNGDTYARFRLSTDNLTVDDSTGAASDGEVEDYQLSLSGVQPDYGDAPDSLTGSVSAADNLANNGNDIPDYRTTKIEGGPSHAQDEDSLITIGSTVDTESNALPNATATGDDLNGDNDEDGVFVAGTGTTDALNEAGIPTVTGSTYSVDVVVDARAPVTVNNSAATITGVAYRDYDLDGTNKPATQNATGTGQAGGEPGIGGVTVNAYDADGNLVTSATTSNVPATLGQYTLNIPAGTQSKLRLEFVAPDGLEAGGNATGEGSLNRFVDTLNDSVNEIDVALNNPGEYIGNTNPYLFTSCFVIGDQVSSTDQHVLVAYRYDGSTPDNNPISLADADQVGSVYGLDFESNSQNIYAATYTKTHTGYGPGGAGAIYQIPITDFNNATAGTPTEYVDLNDIFGPGTVSGVDRSTYPTDITQNNAAGNGWLRDDAGFQGVGKTSLGDLDITEDGKYIMVVNLEDKRLYAIPTTETPNSSNILRFDIPNPNAGLSAARQDDIRPFGLGIDNGKVYVGMVDSAQSSGNRADLSAYVYEFDFDTDTATGTFTNTPVLTHNLDYDRGDAWDSRGISADWQPWQDDFNKFTDGDDTDGYHSAPEDTNPPIDNRYNWLEGAQPMLTDIEFDNGSMILGFRDRLGDQAGANTFNPVDTEDRTNPSDPNGPSDSNDPPTEYYVFQAGDILRAAPNGSGGFNVESAGKVDDGFGGELTSDTTNNNEGPGGGEFYYDNFGGHEQQSLGSLVHLPGFDETAYNAGLGNNRGGTVVVSNVDGSNVDGGTTPREILYSLTPSDTGFNKANGLGDLEALGEAAPIEVGNRIFLDKDEDGIQDANESGIAGVTLRLFSGGTEIATATTDSEGKYSFGGVNAPDLLDPNTAYEIRIDKGTGTPIANYNLTLQNVNSNGSDSLDSDAVDNAGTPTINFTTGEAGENNFTLDAGFIRGITLVGWIDFNRDGVFSDSEAVTLDTDDAQPLVTDGTTPNTLEFTVPPDVEPGVTAARFRVASGLTGDNLDGTTPNGALANGEVEDYMVNLLPVFTISGTVLSDTFEPTNNAINPQDTAIPGVTIQLFADSDGDGNPDTDGNGDLLPAIATEVTDENGLYSFTGLTDGNYVVIQQQPGDYDSVTDADGVDDNSIAVTINGADVTEQVFLEEKVVAIGSTVFRDANNNGTQDAGETGIDGVTVELYDPGADGVIGGGDDTLVGSQPTNNDGNYFFDNLSEGNYYVSIPESNFNTGGALEGTPLSSVTTETTDNPVDGDDNGIQANSGEVTNSPIINLSANSEPDNSIETAQGGDLDDGVNETDGNMTVDFGFVPVFTISGTVLEDTFEPANNEINPGDTPITESVTIQLFAADGNGNPIGNAIASTTTDTNGFYEFPNIGNGDYVVVQTQPTGFNSVTDSDGAPDNQIVVNVNDGDSTGNNFLEERPAGSVSGSVIDQTSGNGINNVTLNLINNDGQIVDTVTTDNTGNYTFDYVLPGNYTVQQLQPFGYNSVSENEGGDDDDNPGNDNTVNNRISVTVGLGDADNGNDVGNDFIEIQARDYGDAPDNQPGTGAGNYQTREADNGASHNVTSGLRIGNNLDTDTGTLQNTTATADDNSSVIDDEDGVNFGSNLQTDDTTYSVDVNVTNNTNQDATLVGWIDFDRNGSFDADEAVSTTIAANSGTTSVPLTWDNDAGNNGDGNGDLPGTGALSGDTIEAGTTYSRFRLSTDASLTGAIDANDSVGNLPDGEVEDHQFDIGSSGAGGGINTPADCVFIGQQDVELTVTFDNTGAIPGYGPFVLLYLDKTGADGAGTETDDGLTFKTAQYLGADVIQTEYTFDRTNDDGDPIALVTVGNEEVEIVAPTGFELGDTVVYMELPFGSFVPEQPPADINVTVDVSDLADNNTPLNILSQTGYKFGEDPLDNPDSDPIILEDISAKPNETIAPQLVKITNNYLGPEDETATGPNFVQQYQIVVDIAPGQTLTNLDVSDLLPDTMQFVDVASIEVADSGAGGVNNGVTISDISTPDDGGLESIGSTNTTENDVDSDGEPTPGGTLTRRFSSVTGTDGADDIVITVDFFVPRLDAQGDVIINADSGDDVFDQNQAQLGDNNTTDSNNIWDAKDSRDGNTEVYIDRTINDDPADPTDPPGPEANGETNTGLNGSNESDAGDDCNDPDHVLEEQSIAIQKGVTNITDSGNSPGDVLEYTLNFQVSDYFAFQDIIVTDTFSDGQRFDTTFTPVVSISEHGTNTNNLDFTFNNYNPGGVSNSSSSETLIIDETDIDNVDDGSGNTVLTFEVSDELIASGFDPQLIGGGVPQGGFQDLANLNNNPPLPNDGTVGTITFRTIIQDAYSDNFPSGDPSLDQNDVLINDAIIDGAVLDVLDPDPDNGTEDALTPTGLREDDDTNAEIAIEDGNLFKSIYAVNGVIAEGADTDNDLSDGLTGYDPLTEVAPGDTITYRLTYQLPISDVEELQFTDFFPLPVFDVGTEFANPTFSTTFDPNGAAVPAAGETHYGRLDTFHQINGAPVPNLSLNAGANSLNYFYGDFDDPNNNASVVDLLVTVTTENDPFADNLLLTNQVRQSQENTFNEVSTRDAIIQITLREPVLEIKKGVVAFSSDRPNAFDPTTASPSEITFTPGSAPTFSGDNVVSSSDLDTTPIDSNLTGGLEAGDVVTFAIAVENTGGSRKGAFDVRIQDILPDGFEIPAGGLNLNVTDGTGATLTYTGLGDPQGVGDDLFGNGIELIDPGATDANGTGLAAETDAGAIDGYILDSNDIQTNPGRNVAIISYDLQVTTPSPYVDPATLENTARVVSYSNLEGGESFPSINDNATVEIERPEATKSIVTTSEAHTPEAGDGSNNANAREVTIGEIVRYRLVAEIPEGNAVNFILRDRLPNGQTFLNDGTSTVAFVSNGSGISSSNPNGSTLNLGLGTAPANTGNTPDDANNFVTLSDNAIGSNNGITTNADNYSTGIDVRFKLGDIINSDRDADDEFIVIEFNALVDNNNDSANKRNDLGEFKSNNFQIISDGTELDASNNVKVEIVEPVIDDVEQTVSLDGTNFSESVNADSQDTVTFQVTFSNTGNSTAYDVNLTDNLPAGLENFTFDPNDVTLSNGATGVAANPNPNPDNELDLIIDAIPVGGSVTVTYTAQVANGVAPDLTITNTADVTYTSLPGTGTTSNPTGSDTPGASGAVNGERDGSDGEGVNPNDYADSDPALVNTPPLDPIKSLVATSEASTGTNEGESTTDFDLTIGEIARYRMVVQIPEGNTNNLQITDLLPEGLRYLDDGTSQIALISDGGLSSDTIIDSDPANPNLASNNPSFTPEFDITASDSADAGTTFESGEDPTFSIGNLTNTDSDANSELVVIEFNALVENITANQDPGTLDNSFTVDADNATARTSTPITIDLVEPVIDDIEQTVSLDGNNFSESVNADAQDTVTFQVTFSNTGNNTAFDVDLSDTLPAGELENLSVTDITSSPGVTGITDNSNATDLDLNIESIPVGGSVTVTYTAQVADGVAPDLTITNTADVTYTSLPGTGTTSNPTGSDTPGASGAINGERDGSDGEGVNPNDYADSDPADVNTPPLDPIKSLVATSEASTGTDEGASTSDSDLTIGEIARYRMVVQIPEGNTNNVVITDLLPIGLRYLDDGTSKIALVSDGGLTSSVIIDNNPASPNLAQSSSSVPPEFDITATDSASDGNSNGTFESGEDPVFNLGNLTNADSDPNSELVVIEFNALVENITANQDPGTLENSFSVDADNATARTSTPITIDLVEPVIDDIEQTVSLDGNNFSESVNADSQDTVTFQVTFSNTGNNTAFDVDLSDTLPAGELENLSVTDITSSPGVTGITDNSNATDLDLNIDTIPVGGSVTVTYTAQVADGVAPDLTITNTADVTYTSLPGTGTISNLTGSDTPGASGAINGERDGSDGATGSPNDYADSDPADVTINSYSIGSTVFEDIDNDGIQEPANENGIQDVVVRLFDSTGTTEIPVGPDGILGTNDDAAGGVQTDIDGNYLFTGLEPGNYQIKIPDSNFAPGGALENASLSSIPTDTADNGQDGDDNGIQTGGLGTEVVSPVIELSAGDEPTAAETLPGGDLDDALNDANGDMTVDFGFVPVFAISGTVLSDTFEPANNAIDNLGDTPIQGVTIQLFADSDGDGNPDDLNAPLDTKETDENGFYSFTGLTDGNYVVIQQQPGDYDSVTDIDGVDDNSIAVTVAGADVTGRDFLEEKVVSIGSTVFRDANNNGIQDPGETGIASVDVELYDLGADGAIGGDNDNLIQTSDTNGDGNYFFDNLPEGDYYVSIPQSNFNTGGALEATPLSSSNTDNADNQEDGDDNGIQANSGEVTNSPVINLTANSEPTDVVETAQGGDLDNTAGDNDGDMTIDFGFVPVFAISGTVLSDTFEPANNEINPEDTPIQGVTLNLYADSDGDGNPDTDNDGNLLPPIETKETDVDGNYSFTGLTDGNYVVLQEQPTDYDSVTDVDGVDDNAIAVTINGADVTGRDFLEEKVVSIGSTVFRDANNNGIQDPGETGIASVDVELYDLGADGAIGGDNDNLIQTSDTNGDGNYFFDNLPEGDYYVSIPQSNFNTGGALEATPLSSSNTDNADNQEDGDDNGIQTGGIGTEVTSPVISLLPGSEPLDTGAETAQGNNQDNLRDGNGDMTIDFGFVPKNIVTGTGGSDVIDTTTNDGATAGNDFIIGGAGQDTLTGGGGNDCFHFNRTSDGIDIIKDFDPNGDVLDFGDLFATGGELAGVSSSDPVGDGYVEVVGTSTGTLIKVDFDPSDDANFDPSIHPFSKNVVLLENVNESNIDASDFIF